MHDGDFLADVGFKFSFDQAVLHQLEMQNRRRLYRERPEIWAHDILGVVLWSKQVEVCHSVVHHKSTMVAAGHGVGKSFLTAVLICWWIDVHPIGEARVLTTAPTTAQVKGIVWREVQLLHRRSRERHAEYLEALENGESTEGLPDHALPGYVTSQATWKSDDGLELGLGRTPPRGREGDAFQGVHGGVFAIADEAVGVSKEMIDTLRNNTTANDERILMMANPTNPASEMGQIWNDPVRCTAWNRITISVLESPHFTDEGKLMPEEVMKHMTNKKYVEDKKVEYGTDSANYKARVEGRWALDTGFILFPEDVLMAGLEATVVPDEDDDIRVGFDVARSEKGDWSYLYTAQEGFVYETHEWRVDPESPDGNYDWLPLAKPRKTDRRGVKIRYLDRWRGLPFFPMHNSEGQRTVSVAANERVHAHMIELGATQLRIDADGMGTIMHDAMIDVSSGEYIMSRMKGGDRDVPDKNAWYNFRAFWYSSLADRMKRGEVDLEADFDEAPLCKELGAIEYLFSSGTAEAIQIMSKKDMRSKGIKSPDAADAAIYASAKMDIDSMTGRAPGDKFQLDLNMLTSSSLYGSNSFWG